MGAVHPRIALAAVCAAILVGGVAGCGGSPSSLTPLSGGVAPAVIAFGCPEASGSLAEVDPSNGSVLWTWKVPEGWELDPQTAAVVNTGAHEGYVVAAPISLIPKSNAARGIAVAPGPAVDTKIAGYGSPPSTTWSCSTLPPGIPSGISKGSTRRP
jgi:hypothetical protein